MGEDFRLKWNDHHSVFFSTAEQLCNGDHLTDVTLSCGSKEFNAHKLVLSICSTYFNQLFAPKPGKSRRNAEAIVYLKDVDSRHMELLLNYMYRGEINVEETELMGLLATAKSLQIKGLTDNDDEESEEKPKNSSQKRPSSQNFKNPPQNLPPKRIKTESKIEVPETVEIDEEFTQPSEFVNVHDPEAGGEILDESDFNLDENHGEDMVYEGDPENPGELSVITREASEQNHSQHRIKLEVSERPEKSFKEPNSHGCFACPKSFAHKWMLDRHILTHTGEQPFACSICWRRFSLQASCLRHVRHVHKDVQGHLSNFVVKVSENTPIKQE